MYYTIIVLIFRKLKVLPVTLLNLRLAVESLYCRSLVRNLKVKEYCFCLDYIDMKSQAIMTQQSQICDIMRYRAYLGYCHSTFELLRLLWLIQEHPHFLNHLKFWSSPQFYDWNTCENGQLLSSMSFWCSPILTAPDILRFIGPSFQKLFSIQVWCRTKCYESLKKIYFAVKR